MQMECVCGSQAYLQYKSEQGRVKNKVVTINNVPIYYCEDCQGAFTMGPNSMRFAERVKIAVESGVEWLEF